MVERQQSTLVVGVFRDYSQAVLAVAELDAIGLNENQIGFAAPGELEDPEGTSSATENVTTAEGATAGFAGGGVAGGILGAAMTGVIPGIGPFIAVGTMTAILGGIIAGGATVSLAGALVGAGVSQDEADIYEEELRAGRSVVMVETEPEREVAVREILERFGAYDAGSRPV
jgi:hypothetical protein